MNRDKLKRIVEAIEAAEQSIKDLSDHKRELYAGVKDEFEPKVLRKIIARRKLEPDLRKRDDDLLDQYESALGMTGELARAAASGEKTYQEAADDAGVSRRTMARHVKRARVPKATENGAPQPDLSGRDAPSDEHSDAGDDEGFTLAITTCVDGGECLDVRCDLEGCLKRPQEPDVKTALPSEEITPECKQAGDLVPTSSAERITPAESDLTIPPFLRRERVSA